MTTLRVLLWDQLSLNITSLQGAARDDLIWLGEIDEDATYVKHHPKKLVYLWSAMRHFKKTLEQAGYRVCYVQRDDPENTQALTQEIERVMQSHDIDHVVITHPGEYRVLRMVEQWQSGWDCTVTMAPDNRFLCSSEAFDRWAKDNKQLRMEFFYRHMRQELGCLMDRGKPIGGQWNFDHDNRKKPPKDLQIPQPFKVEPDSITRAVMSLVDTHYNDHFGDLEPFHYAVTHDDAHRALLHFMEERLCSFGDYQDAMLCDEPWMYHAHISLYLNNGLLDPRTCIDAAEQAYHEDRAPLNAVEGFIRQIVGWREFVRGIYWLHMPTYAQLNALDAERPLPAFFWTAETNMNCLKQCITQTQKHAYAHHIQRLMVIGNFALLTGLDPRAVCEWYLIVYIDAFEWVEMPNVLGMILYADDGIFATKPYAAGGNYIHKMSNYCKDCHYKISQKEGEQACPFHYLYWHFLERHRDKFQNNQRLSMMYATYDRMSDEKKDHIRRDAKTFLSKMEALEDGDG